MMDDGDDNDSMIDEGMTDGSVVNESVINDDDENESVINDDNESMMDRGMMDESMLDGCMLDGGMLDVSTLDGDICQILDYAVLFSAILQETNMTREDTTLVNSIKQFRLQHHYRHRHRETRKVASTRATSMIDTRLLPKECPMLHNDSHPTQDELSNTMDCDRIEKESSSNDLSYYHESINKIHHITIIMFPGFKHGDSLTHFLRETVFGEGSLMKGLQVPLNQDILKLVMFTREYERYERYKIGLPTLGSLLQFLRLFIRCFGLEGSGIESITRLVEELNQVVEGQ